MTYNKIAEHSQDQQLLLNAVRASFRRPLVFTSLSSVAVTESDKLTLGLSLPYENIGEAAKTFSPSVEGSTSGVYTVGVLDTDEFYKGILKPVDWQVVDYLLKRGISKRLLFSLLISDITVVQSNGKGEVSRAVLKNYPGVDDQYDDFENVLDYLVSEGLTTASFEKAEVIGAPLAAGNAMSSEVVARQLATDGVKLQPAHWCELSAEQRLAYRLSNKSNRAMDNAKICGDKISDSDDLLLPVVYVLKKVKESYAPCFESELDPLSVSTCKEKTEVERAAALKIRSKRTENSATIASALPPKLRNVLKRNATRGSWLTVCDESVSYQFNVRSTYSIIYYLGEIVRKETHPDQSADPINSQRRTLYVVKRPGAGGAPQDWRADRDVRAPCQRSYMPRSDQLDHDYCIKLFDVAMSRVPALDFASVNYEGFGFYVPLDALGDRTNGTYEVMDIVAELLALHRSSKDLPATNVLTVSGPR